MNLEKKIPLVLGAALLVASCSVEPEAPKVASVNDSPILVEELKREVSTASRTDPSLELTDEAIKKILGEMIDRKLLIQEAVEMGLSEDERFIRTIKAYWEQTLIRELVAAKTREWSEELFVTEDEARAHYERMKWKADFRTMGAATKAEAEKLSQLLTEDPSSGESSGPFVIEEVSSDSPLYLAFELAEGTSGVYATEDGFTAITVDEKKPVEVPPYGELSERIKATLLEEKKQKALEEWMEELENRARIEINSRALGEITGD